MPWTTISNILGLVYTRCHLSSQFCACIRFMCPDIFFAKCLLERTVLIWVSWDTFRKGLSMCLPDRDSGHFLNVMKSVQCRFMKTHLG